MSQLSKKNIYIYKLKRTSLALSILLISLAGGVYGQPDFEETKLLAEQGNATAQYNLGVMYHGGGGVPENYVEAVKWYRLAAEQAMRVPITI